jgi:hypothetical protein
LLITANKCLYTSLISYFAFASNLILYFNRNSILLDIKRSFYIARKSFAFIIISYSIISSFKGEVIAKALSIPDKAIINANNINLTIFLVIFFLIKLS